MGRAELVGLEARAEAEAKAEAQVKVEADEQTWPARAKSALEAKQ